VAQSLALTRSFGLEPALFLDAISGGHLESPFVATKGRAMTEGDFEAGFTVAGGLKDAELILRDAEGGAADLVGCLLERQRRVVDAGHGDEDLAAVYRDYSA
jgi:3-hydroxyisobutyrate dehydrogenase